MQIQYIPNKNTIYNFLNVFKNKNIKSISVDFSKTESTVIHELIEKNYCIQLIFDIDDNNKNLIINMIKYHIMTKYNGVIGFLKQTKTIKTQHDILKTLVNTINKKIIFVQYLPRNDYTLEVIQNLNPKTVNPNVWIKLKTNNKLVCCYCGCFRGKLSKEHVIPKSKLHNSQRVVLLTHICDGCNSSRRAKELSMSLDNDHWFLKFLELNYGGTSSNTLIENARNPIKSDSFSEVFINE